MEYHYPKFTPEMKKTHTILIPNMAVTQSVSYTHLTLPTNSLV